ncbi:hypothetical protein ABB02_00977 [Clostridiaceae bacterium JG1575]|nr:hypothetical protein ABB02_00977 [Clostridiaceae bacterium JG1575]
MLSRLGHDSVSSRYHEDGAVHLSGSRDHVLYIVGVSRAVHVSIVTVVRLIFHVSGINGDSSFFFFRRLVDFIVLKGVGFSTLGQNRRDGGRQRGLAVVDVTDGPDVNMGFGTFKFCFSHWFPSSE